MKKNIHTYSCRLHGFEANFEVLRIKGRNFIHPSAIIELGAVIGSDNYIGPYCIVYKEAVIGNGNTFLSHVTVGGFPEHKSALEKGEWKKCIIGNNNTVNEFVTLNAGVDGDTIIGSDCILLRGVHVGHDAWIGDQVTLSCNVIIGGHSIVEDFVNMGLGAICHQFSYIGAGTMIGMGTIIPKRRYIEPFNQYVGNPSSFLKPNEYLISKNKLTEKMVDQYRKRYRVNHYALEQDWVSGKEIVLQTCKMEIIP